MSYFGRRGFVGLEGLECMLSRSNFGSCGIMAFQAEFP